MKKGIAIAGNMIVDFVKYIDVFPTPNTLVHIHDVVRATGGLVCNCVLDLAKLDPALPLKAIGMIGQDDAGDYVLDQFSKYPSIDTSGILREGVTSFTDVMTERGTGARTFFTFGGANDALAPRHFDFSKIEADILHIGYILLLDSLDQPDPDYPTAMCRVLDNARKAGILTSIDVVSEDSQRFSQLVPPALAYADFCIINEIEASRSTGIELRNASGELMRQNLRPVCEKLMEMGVSRWAIIHMPELSCGLEKGGAYVQADSLKIPAGFKISSVGAGDAFASGILYGAYNGWTLERSIYTASAVAAFSLSGTGACDAIIELPKILEQIEKFQMQ